MNARKSSFAVLTTLLLWGLNFDATAAIMKIEPESPKLLNGEPVFLRWVATNDSDQSFELNLGERGVEFFQFWRTGITDAVRNKRLGSGGIWISELLEVPPHSSVEGLLLLDDWFQLSRGTNQLKWSFDNQKERYSGDLTVTVIPETKDEVLKRLDHLVIRIQGAPTQQERNVLREGLRTWLERSDAAGQWAVQVSSGSGERARVVRELLAGVGKRPID
jgi:hypothetical protein